MAKDAPSRRASCVAARDRSGSVCHERTLSAHVRKERCGASSMACDLCAMASRDCVSVGLSRGKKIKDHQTGREARMRVLRNGHRNSARNKTLGIASDRGRRRGDESTVSVINALGSERRRKEALAAPSNAKKNFSNRIACVARAQKVRHLLNSLARACATYYGGINSSSMGYISSSTFKFLPTPSGETRFLRFSETSWKK
jgi:hypothetical protein